MKNMISQTPSATPFSNGVEDNQEEVTIVDVDTSQNVDLDVDDCDIQAVRLAGAVRRLAKKQWHDNWQAALCPHVATEEVAIFASKMRDQMCFDATKAFAQWLSFDHPAPMELRLTCLQEAISQLDDEDGVWRAVLHHPLFDDDRKQSCDQLNKLLEDLQERLNKGGRMGVAIGIGDRIKRVKFKLSYGGHVVSEWTPEEILSTMLAVPKILLTTANNLLRALNHEPILSTLAVQSLDVKNKLSITEKFAKKVEEYHASHKTKTRLPPVR